MDKKTLGDKIISLREQQMLSQNKLAKRAQVSQSLLSVIEKYQGDPKLSTLMKIATALDVTVEYLLSEESDKKIKCLPHLAG